MADRHGGWMQTFTGKQFWPLDPRPEELDILDIAHHLALTTRYGGASKQFYSVAQHSVLCSRICDPEHALEALMHDGSETYLGDMIRPLKHGPGMEAFRMYERVLERVIARRYGLVYPWPADVERADAVMLATEKRDILTRPQVCMNEDEWLHGASAEEAAVWKVVPVNSGEAEIMFLHRWKELTHDRIIGAHVGGAPSLASLWQSGYYRAPFTGDTIDPGCEED